MLHLIQRVCVLIHNIKIHSLNNSVIAGADPEPPSFSHLGKGRKDTYEKEAVVLGLMGYSPLADIRDDY